MRKQLQIIFNIAMLAGFFGCAIALGFAAVDGNIIRMLLILFAAITDLIVMGFVGVTRLVVRGYQPITDLFRVHKRSIDEDRKDDKNNRTRL